MDNIFTIDLEDWYHANYHGDSETHSSSRVISPTLKILELLKKTNNYATFFVLGSVAQKYPNLIKEIEHQGHEIASHSFNHQLVYSLTETEFIKDTEKSLTILSKISRKPIIGYRAPSWSVSQNKTPWFWKSLSKLGFKYSSSLFPFKTFLYGDSSANPLPHLQQSILEIPPSIFTIYKKNIPFSGGFYLRLFPTKIIKLFTQKLNNNKVIVNYYIHPREIDQKQPKLKNLTAFQYFIHYYNIKNTKNKLEELLYFTHTKPIRDFLNELS